MSRDDYVGHLRKNVPCLWIEPALVAAGIHRLLPDWDARQRGRALELDLTALGLHWRRGAVTIAGDDGTLLGWAYVLEGSRFGARLILRVVEATPDAGVRGATRFLRHGEGADFWIGFRAALARIDHDSAAIANACNGARAAFGQFLDAASGGLGHRTT